MLHLFQKTEQRKTGVDLLNAVSLSMDNKVKFYWTSIITLVTYQEMPLKSATRNEKYSKSNPQHCNITSSTNILLQSKKQLLAHKKTKRSLLELLMGSLRDHLSHRGVEFVVAGNFITYHPTYCETTNNHQEADGLLIHCITSWKLYDKRIWVYASDVDVVVLLVAHCNL